MTNNQEAINVLEKRLNLQPTQGSLIDIMASTQSKVKNRSRTKPDQPCLETAYFSA